MRNESVWVIGFSKETGIREKFVCCPIGSSNFYKESYQCDGYDTVVLSGEEVDSMIEKEKNKK